jgi:hypothetical protein
MQDGTSLPAEEAGQWLRENLRDTPEPKISMRWDVNDEHDEDAYRRLLKLLFGPRADSGAL